MNPKIIQLEMLNVIEDLADRNETLQIGVVVREVARRLHLRPDDTVAQFEISQVWAQLLHDGLASQRLSIASARMQRAGLSA